MSLLSIDAWRSTLLTLLKVDTLHRTGAVLEELHKTERNATFFSCYQEEDPSVKARMRCDVRNASISLRKSLTESLYNKIEKQFFDKGALDSDFHILSHRDTFLNTLNSGLNELSFIQRSLSQQIHSRPTYYPSPTIFRRREEQRIIEFIFAFCDSKMKHLNETFIDTKKKLDPKSYRRLDLQPKCPRILIINEHFNTTQFYNCPLSGDHRPLQDQSQTLVLRVPYWFANFSLYYPVLTHEMIHFLLQSYNLFSCSDLSEPINELTRIHNREFTSLNRYTNLSINILNEVFADIMSASIEGFSYLIGLLLSCFGTYDRFYVDDSRPYLSQIPWSIRASLVSNHLKNVVYRNNVAVRTCCEAVDKIIEDYRMNRDNQFIFSNYRQRAMEITNYEVAMTELIHIILDPTFKSLHSSLGAFFENSPASADNCHNIQISDEIFYKLLKAQFSSKHLSKVDLNDRTILDKWSNEIRNFIGSERISMSNVISTLFLYALSQYSGPEPIPMGRVFRLIYDYIQSNGEWTENRQSTDVIEVCMIKHRLDVKCESIDDKVIIDSKASLEWDELEQGISDFSKDKKFFNCFGPFDQILMREGYSPRKYYRTRPLAEYPPLAFFYERKVLDLIFESNDSKYNNGIFDFFIDIRLTDRKYLMYLDNYIRSMNFENDMFQLCGNRECFRKYSLYCCLDWQDAAILIEDADLGVINALWKCFVINNAKVKVDNISLGDIIERTLTTIMYHPRKREQINELPLSTAYPVTSWIRIKSDKSDWGTMRTSDLCTSNLVPGIYDYLLNWKTEHVTFGHIIDHYKSIFSWVSDIQTEIMFQDDKKASILNQKYPRN